MSISVSGGAGSFDAHLDDLVAVSGVIATTGATLRSLSDDAARASVNGSVIASGLLCPAELAAAEAAIVWATAGPDGCLTTGLALEGTAHLVEAAVTTYRVADDVGRELLDTVESVAGMALGAAAVVGAVGSLAYLTAHPLALAALLANKDALLGSLQQTLFDHPWLMEAATRLAPGAIQGLSFSGVGVIGSLLGGQGGLALALVVAAGGRWPTTDYESSIAGLIAVGQKFGYFQDVGDWHVSEVAKLPEEARAPKGVGDIFAQQRLLGMDEAAGQVQIVQVVGSDGVTRWIVQIPGTQDWSPTRTDNPIDLTSNVHLMSREAQTAVQRQIEKAMVVAGIAPGDPVMLTGHSQGGITAAACASDPSFTQRFNVTSVVTGGSPIARMNVPDSVSVLSVEHAQDPVPMLDGAANPARDNWLTVTKPLDGQSIATTTGAAVGPGTAHATEYYSLTGQEIDESNDPSLQAWLKENSGFLNGDPKVTRWRVSG